MATYYVDGAVGDDGNAGTSEGAGNAWATLTYAETQLSAGDKVYIKNSATYNEQVSLSISANGNSPVTWEGYETTPGDGGIAVIDGQSSRSYGFTGYGNYQAFKNLKVQNTTNHGFNLGTYDYLGFYNCHADNCGGYGFYMDDYCVVDGCTAYDCSTGGLEIGRYGSVLRSVFGDNPVGIHSDGIGTFYCSCIIYGFTTYGVHTLYAGTVLNCTIDGENGVSTTGVYGQYCAPMVHSSILYRCNLGVSGAGYKTLAAGGPNLFYGNSTDTSGWVSNSDMFEADVTSDPLFTDDSTHDYALEAGSPARNAGRDAGTDLGAIQSQDTGGGSSRVVLLG